MIKCNLFEVVRGIEHVRAVWVNVGKKVDVGSIIHVYIVDVVDVELERYVFV